MGDTRVNNKYQQLGLRSSVQGEQSLQLLHKKAGERIKWSIKFGNCQDVNRI